MLPALALLLAISPAPARADSAPASVVVDSQVVQLELDPSKEHFTGNTTLWVRLASRTRYLRLDMAGPSIARVALSTPAGPAELLWGERPAGTLLIETSRPVGPGPAAIYVAFDGTFADSGVGLVRTVTAELASVQARFARGGARRAFACFDDALHPTRWRLWIETPRDARLRSPLLLVRRVRLGGDVGTALRSRGRVSPPALRFEVTRARPRRP